MEQDPWGFLVSPFVVYMDQGRWSLGVLDPAGAIVRLAVGVDAPNESLARALDQLRELLVSSRAAIDEPRSEWFPQQVGTFDVYADPEGAWIIVVAEKVEYDDELAGQVILRTGKADPGDGWAAGLRALRAFIDEHLQKLDEVWGNWPVT